jgi:hypothetical protein
VIDTSSLLQVRRDVPRSGRSRVFKGLSALVSGQQLVFPCEVYEELRVGHDGLKPGSKDEAFDWAKAVHDAATRHGTDYEAVRRVLAKVPDLVDYDKPRGPDDADPYVVALALRLREMGHDVIVVTEDRNDKPDKTSIATACGLLRLVRLPMLAFLADRGIWRSG